MYSTEKPKCKGIRFSKDNAPTEFLNILHGGKIHQDRFVKLRTALRSNDEHKFGKLKPNQIIPIEKSCDLEDTKRKWTKKFDLLGQQDSEPIHL
jgi:hypothetical protein